MNDFRFAFRQLFKLPGFTGTAVLTLALGIGVNSALFSILYAVLLEPLPYPAPERLVQVQSTIARPGKPTEIYPVWSYPRFELLRDQNRLFDQIAAYDNGTLTVGGSEGAGRVEAELASASYFPLLGIHAAQGRVFLPEEDRKGGAGRVVVISAGFWQRRFGGDPAAIGQTLRVNELPLTIIGVLPPGFRGQTGTAELWVPITLTPALMGDPDRLGRPFTMWHRVLARLKPATGLAAARAGLDSLETQLESALRVSSEKETYGIALAPIRETLTDPLIRRSLWVLAGAVGFVLLIACVNIANLQLARGAGRQRELAVRLALGASRVRLARQLLAENLILAAVAGLVALLFSRWAVSIMAAFQPADSFGFMQTYARLPDFGSIQMRTPAVVFNFAIALGCGLLVGVLPAWRATHEAPARALGRLGDRPDGAHRMLGLRGMRGLLVVAETALALVLLAGAGLMVHSLARLATTRLGFDPNHLLTFRLDSPRGASEAASQLFFQQVLDRVRAIPGVNSVCLANATPLSGTFDRSIMAVRPAGKEGEPAEAFIGVHLASTEFLRTLRVPLLRGRWLSDKDRPGAPAVVVLNETAAHRYWGGQDPLGQQVDLTPALGPGFPKVEVVGVVGDVKYDQVSAETGPDIYLSYRQSGYPGHYVTLRADGPPTALAGAVRAAVASVNSDVPIYDLLTMDQRIANSISRSRFNTLLLLAFSVLATVLAVIGLYGVVAYSVSQRTREIGIRIALGARVADVFQLVLKQGMLLVLVGTVLGLAGALSLTRLLQSLLFGVSALDPLTFTAIPSLLAAVALLACWLPARRATRVDPVEALRYE